MDLRVTNQTQYANAANYIRQQASALARYQDQVSSGLRIKVASDDPISYVALAQTKAAAMRFESYAQTVADSTAALNGGVDSLQAVNQLLVRAKQIAQEGANSETTPQAYEALATEVDRLIERAVAAGNSQFEGRYVFGGTATDTPPFRAVAPGPNQPPTSVAYDGAAERASALVFQGQTVDTRYVGSSVFQGAGADVFQSLIGLRDELRDTVMPSGVKTQALSQRIDSLESARSAIGDATGEQASNLASLRTLETRMSDLKLNADIRIGELGGTDYAEAVVKIQEHQSTLEATLTVSSKLLQPSLLDFIR